MSSSPTDPGNTGSSPWGIDASTGPDELQAPPAIRASRFPRWALVLSVVLVCVVAVAGAGLAAWRYNADKPQVVITASGPHTVFPLVPPLRVGDYSRDANANATPTPNPATKVQTVATTYSKDGQAAFVLLMSRPVTDGKKFLADTGLSGPVAFDDGWCGTSTEANNRDGCAVLRDNTAILVLDLSGMSRTDLKAQADAFARQLAGQ